VPWKQLQSLGFLAFLPCEKPYPRNPHNPWFSGFLHFPRNLSPDFLQYTSERPEMTPKGFGAREGQNNKTKNHENRQRDWKHTQYEKCIHQASDL
jgi:hypothetical protein